MDNALDVIASFDYDDGPSKGVARHCEGYYIRFIAVGDSESRMSRAFVMSRIDGDWSEDMRLQRKNAMVPSSKILVARTTTPELIRFERSAFSAKSLVDYASIGNRNMEKFSTIAIDRTQRLRLLELGSSLSGFSLAKSLVKIE